MTVLVSDLTLLYFLSSRSEEKAKLLRRIGSAIQEKNEELESYLASMQLDTLTLETGSENLPQVRDFIFICINKNNDHKIMECTF